MLPLPYYRKRAIACCIQNLIIEFMAYTGNMVVNNYLVYVCGSLKGHGHDVRVRIFLCTYNQSIRRFWYSSSAAYNVHVLLTTPTEFTDSCKYAETLRPRPFSHPQFLGS